MTGNSILIGRAFGIPIRAHILLILLLPVLAILYSDHFLFGLALAVGLFAGVALHELGHSLVAQRKGCHVQEILLTPIGGAAKMSHIPSHPTDEIQLALAGPLTSLVIGAVGLMLPGLYFKVLGTVNLVLAGFNLIPCFPMDGGRVLRALLARRKGRLEGTRLAVKTGAWFCALFVVIGLLQSQWILIVIGLYIWHAGQMEYRMVRFQHQTAHFGGAHIEPLEVEVSPPPYAAQEHGTKALWHRLHRLFRRGH